MCVSLTDVRQTTDGAPKLLETGKLSPEPPGPPGLGDQEGRPGSGAGLTRFVAAPKRARGPGQAPGGTPDRTQRRLGLVWGSRPHREPSQLSLLGLLAKIKV